jgi:type I restriction enzyme S subunit
VEVLLPPLNIQDKVAKQLENCIQKIRQNEDESRILATIRDALLPKLMSDEIRISTNSNLNNENK